jgi:DNA-binding XRE family transcriptional regulator
VLMENSTGSPIPVGMIRGKQLKAARDLVGMRQIDLAKAVGISATALMQIEKENVDPRASTKERIVDVLEKAGAEFIDDGEPSPGGGPGVRLRGPKPEVEK